MKCTLMNKNKEVMLTEYDSATGVFTSIYDVYNIDYAPYILKSFYFSYTFLFWEFQSYLFRRKSIFTTSFFFLENYVFRFASFSIFENVVYFPFYIFKTWIFMVGV